MAYPGIPVKQELGIRWGLTVPFALFDEAGTHNHVILTHGQGAHITVASRDGATPTLYVERFHVDGPPELAPTAFTELRAPATLTVADSWTATGATIPASDGDEWVRMNGSFDGEVPENFEFLSSRLRNLAEHIIGGSTSTGDVERLQFHDGSVFQRVLMAQTSAGEIILRHETASQSLGNLSVYSYSAVEGGVIGTIVVANPTGTDGSELTRLTVGENNYFIPAISGGVTHIESGATYNNNVITVSTTGTVRGGDGILFAVPTPFGTSATQAVSLAIDGQANSEHPLRDRNGDALHEADLAANAVYVAISDADSWDILVLPSGGGLSADEQTKFDGIETGATADQTGDEIVGLLEALAGDAQLSYNSLSDIPTGTGAITLTPRTEAAHNFNFNNTIQSGQERDLFDANITLPADLADDAAFIVRINATHGYAEIVLTKALLEELVAVAPVTWSTSATGTAAVNSGATQNVYFIPLGQNRGAYVGRSNEDPLSLLWAYSHNGAVVLDMQLMTLTASGSAGGQESPGTPGVAALTPDLVRVAFWKWVLTTDGKPADPTAHWRFDDEWDGTTPFQGGGWYVADDTALDEADNNPAFSQDTWTLWNATEQTRRNVVNDAYTYTDGGYTVTAVWDVQYSFDGTTWTTVRSANTTVNYIRYRNQETGEWGDIIPVGTNVGSNDWQPIRTNDLVYPGGSNQDELDAVYDFGDFAELLFIVAGYRSITVPDGMGGTMVIGVNGPWHHYVVNRGGGWPVADISEGEDNNDADDGSCFQFTYFATNTGVGLQIWERGDELSGVNPGNPPFLQNDSEPPTQLGGHFKIVSTDGDEAHVTKFRFFAFSNNFARTTMSIFARYR